MCPEFQRLCAIYASGALESKNIRPPQVNRNWSQDGDYDSVDKGLFDYLYKGYEADSRELWSIHTDTVQYTSDMRVCTDLTVEDAIKRNGQIRVKIEDLEYYPSVSNVLMHGFRPGQTISATYLGQNERNLKHKIDEKVNISVSMHAICTGTIQGINQLVNILWDTGATQCLISGKTAE